jgi:hypothetical protein
MSIYIVSFQSIGFIVIVFGLVMLACEQISFPVSFAINTTTTRVNNRQSLSDIVWISFNAFTSIGEGTNRPATMAGLLVEFFICFLGFMTIPRFVQTTYRLASKTIDEQRTNDDKRKTNYLVMIEDEHGHRAIGQINHQQDNDGYLPEILIQYDEF